MESIDNKSINLSTLSLQTELKTVKGGYVTLLDESFYKIENYDSLEPFFITLISSSNHWLFVSTTGGLTAGRTNAGHAIFPYYTVDKITENSENTGPKTIILVQTDTGRVYWEPFSQRHNGVYAIQRNLYKNISGTTLMFEEINKDFSLTFRYMWRTSEAYGFVRTAYLLNHGDEVRQVEVLDGLQNILPAHVPTDVQNQLSNLLDAYKFSELHVPTSLGLFSLNSRLTDLAEPSESLRTNTVWHMGFEDATVLLSSKCLDQFRRGQTIVQEEQVRGQRGAYFVNASFAIEPNAEHNWHLVADVDHDSASVVGLVNLLTDTDSDLSEKVKQDILASQQHLEHIIAASDGLQHSADQLSTAHHYANVLFNVMRGGIFADNYNIDTADLRRYVTTHNRNLVDIQSTFFDALPSKLTLSELYKRVQSSDDSNLIRIITSYLPLTFSRRHGDPSRPWNRFEINIKQPDGSQRLDYQGNWRDIFQNWEALSYSYPEFNDAMIANFLNATTADGYNPYRITRDGIDWEAPEPDNAWANIGYWNDHQIIYLQKLLETSEQFYPQKLQSLLQRRIFSYADVPYKIRPYADMIEDAYDTIDFDWEKEEHISKRVASVGADGKLVHDADGQVVHASLAEKLLLLLLTKLTNFVPEGGIWLNTQRPEWNDANNALVGKGLSVVTLAYIRRYIVFYHDILKTSDASTLSVNQDLATLWHAVYTTFRENHEILTGDISNLERRQIMDALGTAGSAYRWQCYEHGVSNQIQDVSVGDVVDFLTLSQQIVEHSLHANKRDDSLYHAYNVLHLSEGSAEIRYLSTMLEGQVAILSSGLLTANESLDLLKAMRHSDLYREDQHSYMLYPNRKVSLFLEKNIIPSEAIQNIKLASTMHAKGDKRLFTVDPNGTYHFSGDMRNEKDVQRMLAQLANETAYVDLVKAEQTPVLNLFEQVFNHAAFTGRSSTFFAYEGLGSIYWHMVSKLLLAVQETVIAASKTDVPVNVLNALIDVYDDVRAGIGFNKSPEVYGAFPTDPYSHTPWGQGAKQPGMTGMVKEEILTRLFELGIVIENGTIAFRSLLFRQQELLKSQSYFDYIDTHGETCQLELPVGSLAFCLCQVPVLIREGVETKIEVEYSDQSIEKIIGSRLGKGVSQNIFSRNGNVRYITIYFNREN